MAKIAFKTHAIPRSGFGLTTSLDIGGKDEETLKAHALDCIFGSGRETTEWHTFEVEGQHFVARFDSDGDLEVEKLPDAWDMIGLLRQCLFLFNDMPRYRPRNGSQDTYAVATKIETVFRALGVRP